MDVSGQRKRALDIANIAIALDKELKYEDAYHKYSEAAEIMMYVCKCTPISR